MPVIPKIGWQFGEENGRRRTTLLQSVARSRDPEIGEIEFRPPVITMWGITREPRQTKPFELLYFSPSLESKSRGRLYQPTKEDHSITFASFSPHSKASLRVRPFPSLSACLLASRLITRPPSRLFRPSSDFLSFGALLLPLDCSITRLFAPFFPPGKPFFSVGSKITGLDWKQ